MAKAGCLSHDGFLCLGSYDGNQKATKESDNGGFGLADIFTDSITKGYIKVI